MLVVLISLFLVSQAALADECKTLAAEYGTVCVCDSDYCDTTPVLDVPTDGFQIYTTGKATPGHNSQTGLFSEKRAAANVISVGETQRQTIFGFGGAFTDATGINIRSLPQAAQQKLLESYFGKDGNEYSLCRVPIGGTDFSLKGYSYDDVEGDTTLENFRLQDADIKYKVPIIREAIELRGESPFNLFASAWSAPLWMKNHQVWSGYSQLKDEYYQLWADYTLKFFEEYQKNDIDFWGLTTGNEPQNGFYSHEQLQINAMGWVPRSQAKWISENLGPTLRNSSFKDLKIMINDHNRIHIPYYVPEILGNNDSLQYVDGVAVHWYGDSEVPTDVFEYAKTDKKNTFLLMTEACFFVTSPQLGNWDRAAGYIASIIEYLENGFVGWVDWNMALNLTGGPTYIDLLSDSPIVVNASGKEFYKQPLFYALGHFSKFVVPGSVRLDVDSELKNEDLDSVAFLRPDNLIALILFNNATEDVQVQIENTGIYSDIIDVASYSISTVLYAPNDVARKKEW